MAAPRFNRLFAAVALTTALFGQAQLAAAAPAKTTDAEAQAFESNLSEQEFSRFNIHFKGVENRERAWQVVHELNQTYDELGSFFGNFPSTKMDVILLGHTQMTAAWKGPDWQPAGFFNPKDGKIRISLDDSERNVDYFKKTIRHEFTHAFEYKLYPHALPDWFQEGSAEFYGYYEPTDIFWEQNKLDELRRSARGRPWLTVAQLDAIFENLKSTPIDTVHAVYEQSQAFVLQIARERGDSWIPSVFRHLQQGETFDTAFRSVVGVSPEQAMATVGNSLK